MDTTNSNEQTGPNVAEAMSYKLRHEAFVSGLAGGEIAEIYKVSLVAISAYAAWCCLQSRLFYFQRPFAITSLIADFSLNWLGPLFSMTVYSSMPITLSLLVLGPASIIGLSQPISKAFTNAVAKSNSKSKKASEKSDRASVELSEYLPKRSYLTCYRGGMLVLTCAAILAVDFKEFPRRFAKVETWGTSLMDLGVGSFVFSMGLVSARALLIDSFYGTHTPLVPSLVKSFKQSFSVLALGIIRLIAVKALDYQEHVTEYGVHWNFFMTLGLLPPVVTLLGILPTKLIPTSILALIISLCYEVALHFTSLSKFILTAPRTDILSANKEGIFSFLGYLAIFLSGKATGYFLLPSSISGIKSWFTPQSRTQYLASKSNDSRLQIVKILIGSSAVHSILLLISMRWVTPSRRLANLPYVLWIISYNTAFLGLYVIVEAVTFGKSHQAAHELCVPISLEAVNANGLAVFLLANVGTGLVNMNMKTLDATKPQALLVLILYLAALFSVSLLLYRYGIRIKL